MEQLVRAEGHEQVRANHASTFEVTTDNYLTPAGDCILGIKADRAPSDFDPAFVRSCQTSKATIEATITVGDESATVVGRGDEGLSFASDRSMVGRTSDYIDDRTVMVDAGRGAGDLPRDLIHHLSRGQPLRLKLRVDS